MELSIVIAVYNEEEVLAELERRLTAALRAIGKSYEIILVDDGSRDNSLAILLELGTAIRSIFACLVSREISVILR